MDASASVMAAHAWLDAKQPHRVALHFVQAVLTDPLADLGRPADLLIVPEPIPVVMPKLP